MGLRSASQWGMKEWEGQDKCRYGIADFRVYSRDLGFSILHFGVRVHGLSIGGIQKG